MNRVLKIIELIRESFIGSEEVYTMGSCYQFYKILKELFPEANAYYDSHHVITEIDGIFYDITGIVQKERHIPIKEHYPNTKVIDCKYNINGNLAAEKCPYCLETFRVAVK